MDEFESTLDQAFRNTFKVLFGECNKGLADYEDYLRQNHFHKTREVKSAISQKTVALSHSNYADGANYISQDEIDYRKTYAPLNLNNIKDIDSIISSIRERFYYSGNKIFGSSREIKRSDNITDSLYVDRSHNIMGSKYISHSAYLREGCEYCFGCHLFVGSSHMLRALGGATSSRCFEALLCTNCSDTYCSVYCHDCAETMFSFNQHSRRYCIGNVTLEKSKYLQLKPKLLNEMREKLEKDRSFPSIFDLPAPDMTEVSKFKMPKFKEEKTDFEPIGKAFKDTCKVVLGKEIGPLGCYEKFLTPHVDVVKKCRSIFGTEFVRSDFFWSAYPQKERLVSEKEAEELSKLCIEWTEGEELDIEEIRKRVGKIAFFTAQLFIGDCENNIETPNAFHGSHSYRVAVNSASKNSAYCDMPRLSEAVFGCAPLITESKFCLRCSNSYKLTACLDCDGCTNCTYCYFCHNCENVENGIFCFNAKGLRYAIGNVEVGKEKFEKVKKIMLDEITKKIEKDHKLDLSIFNIGCRP